MAFVTRHEEVFIGEPADWQLCFQYVTYNYDDGNREQGYRFIYRKPDGRMQGARGQARIPDAASLQRLIAKATKAGWYVRAEDRDYGSDSRAGRDGGSEVVSDAR